MGQHVVHIEPTLDSKAIAKCVCTWQSRPFVSRGDAVAAGWVHCMGAPDGCSIEQGLAMLPKPPR
jgi:hypothetical protein